MRRNTARNAVTRHINILVHRRHYPCTDVHGSPVSPVSPVSPTSGRLRTGLALFGSSTFEIQFRDIRCPNQQRMLLV
jgi:hypothetical protein